MFALANRGSGAMAGPWAGSLGLATLMLMVLRASALGQLAGGEPSLCRTSDGYHLPWRIESSGDYDIHEYQGSQCTLQASDDHGPTVITLLSGEKAVVRGFTPASHLEVILLLLLVLAYVALRLAYPLRRQPKVLQQAPHRSAFRLAWVGLVEAYVMYSVLHSLHLELWHRPVAYPPAALVTHNSAFLELPGLRLHYLHHDPPSVERGEEAHTVLHANHGFGASSLSWHAMLPTLSHNLDAVTVAHDAPGFGLTEVHHDEETDHESFGFHNSARLASLLLQRHMESDTELCSAVDGVVHEHPPPAQTKRRHVFVGHSMGTMTSTLMALELAEREGAAAGEILLVLESPAILGNLSRVDLPFWLTRLAHAVILGEHLHHSQEEEALEKEQEEATIASSVAHRAVKTLVQGLFRFVLRQSVYSKWFWSTGLTAAWTPDGRPDSHSMTKYRVPSLKRDWDLGLLRFLYTTLKRGWSTGLGVRAFRRALSGEGRMSDMHLVDRLAAVSDVVKVLVVHGREDVVIPVDNSVELVERIHGARLVVIEGCGHIPHEEFPALFTDIVTNFADPSKTMETAVQTISTYDVVNSAA